MKKNANLIQTLKRKGDQPKQKVKENKKAAYIHKIQRVLAMYSDVNEELNFLGWDVYSHHS